MALFRRRPRGYLVSVHLAARLQPMHRGHLFEDPLDEYLARRYPGAHVAGGGTLVSAEERITSCDLEVFVPDTVDPAQAVDDIVDRLRRAGAPRGSRVSVGDHIVEVGSSDLVILRFDHVDDADGEDDDHVLHSARMDAVVGSITSTLGDRVGFVSWQIHSDGSELFLYGPSGRDLREALAGAPALIAGARVLPPE
jgi:hypothetical protein